MSSLCGVPREFAPLIGEPLLVNELICRGPSTEFTVSVLSRCAEEFVGSPFTDWVTPTGNASV